MSSGRSLVQFCSALMIWSFAAGHAGATSYYIHPLLGNDGNSGTNELAPFKTLARAGILSLHSGDKILLAAGQKFAGQLALQNVAGTPANPILISSYPPTAENTDGCAAIDAKGFVAGVCLENCAYIEVANLKITANGGGMLAGQIVKPDQRYGVLITANQPREFAEFTLTNLAIKDIFFEDPGFALTQIK